MLNVLSVLCCIGKGSMRTVLHHVSKKTLFFYGKSDEKERRRFSVSKRLWKTMTIKERREFEHVFFHIYFSIVFHYILFTSYYKAPCIVFIRMNAKHMTDARKGKVGKTFRESLVDFGR